MASNGWQCNECSTDNSFRYKNCATCGVRGRPHRGARPKSEGCYLGKANSAAGHDDLSQSCPFRSGDSGESSSDRKGSKGTRYSCSASYSIATDSVCGKPRSSRRHDSRQDATRSTPRKVKYDEDVDEDEFPLTWTCDNCTFANKISERKCEICSAPKTRQSSASNASKQSTPPKQSMPHKQSMPPKHSMPSKQSWDNQDTVSDNEVRLVMLGKTGAGKSATGNTILNKEAFKSMVSGSSITKLCRRGVASRNGRELHVIDTPGIQDTSLSNEDTMTEVAKCVGLSAPGPHAFLLILRIGRFTAEEKDSVDQFLRHFGEKVKLYMIIVFTGKDDLDTEQISLQEHLRSVPKHLKAVIDECQGRCIAFNNREARGKSQQVDELLKMVDNMLATNKRKYYTNAMYREAETAMKIREAEIRSQQEMDKARERKDIEKDVESRYRRQMNDLEDSKTDLEKQLAHVQSKKTKKTQEMDTQMKHIDQDIADVQRKILSDTTAGRAVDPMTQQKLDQLKKERGKYSLVGKEIGGMQSEIHKLQKQLGSLRQREKRHKQDKDDAMKKTLEEHEKRFKEMESQSREIVRKEVEGGESNIGDKIFSALTGVGKMIIKGLTGLF